MLPTLMVSMDLTVLHLAVPHIERGPGADGHAVAVDRGHLRVSHRGVVDHDGHARRPDRPPPVVADRGMRVRGDVGAGLAVVYQRRDADRGPGVAGRGRRDADAFDVGADPGLVLRPAVSGRWGSGCGRRCSRPGTALGPLLGGLLLERFWWGSVFLIGVPVMAALLVAAPRALPESRDPAAGRLDVLSALLSVGAVLAVIYGLKRAAEHGAGWVPAVAVIAGLSLGAEFVSRQRSLDDPMVDLACSGPGRSRCRLSAEALGLVAWVGTFLFLSSTCSWSWTCRRSVRVCGSCRRPAGSIVGSLLAPLAGPAGGPMAVMAPRCCWPRPGSGCWRGGSGRWVGVAVVASVVFSLGVAPVMALATDVIVDAAPPERACRRCCLGSGERAGPGVGVSLIGSLGAAVYRGDMTDAAPSDAAGGPTSHWVGRWRRRKISRQRRVRSWSRCRVTRSCRRSGWRRGSALSSRWWPLRWSRWCCAARRRGRSGRVLVPVRAPAVARSRISVVRCPGDGLASDPDADLGGSGSGPASVVPGRLRLRGSVERCCGRRSRCPT